MSTGGASVIDVAAAVVVVVVKILRIAVIGVAGGIRQQYGCPVCVLECGGVGGMRLCG